MFRDWFNHFSKNSNGNKMIVPKKNRVEFAEEEPIELEKMGIFNLFLRKIHMQAIKPLEESADFVVITSSPCFSNSRIKF